MLDHLAKGVIYMKLCTSLFLVAPIEGHPVYVSSPVSTLTQKLR